MIVVQKKSGKLRRGYIAGLACTLLLGDTWVVTPLRGVRIWRVRMMGECAGRGWIHALLLVVIWIVPSAILASLRLVSVRHPSRVHVQRVFVIWFTVKPLVLPVMAFTAAPYRRLFREYMRSVRVYSLTGKIAFFLNLFWPLCRDQHQRRHYGHLVLLSQLR